MQELRSVIIRQTAVLFSEQIFTQIRVNLSEIITGLVKIALP